MVWVMIKVKGGRWGEGRWEGGLGWGDTGRGVLRGRGLGGGLGGGGMLQGGPEGEGAGRGVPGVVGSGGGMLEGGPEGEGAGRGVSGGGGGITKVNGAATIHVHHIYLSL